MLDNKLQKLINTTIITLTAEYGTKAVSKFISKYGIKGLLHSKITVNPSSYTTLALHDISLNRTHKSKYIYPFNTASNLYLSRQHMKNIRRTKIPKILRQLLYILKLSRLLRQSSSVRLYTVLYCLKDSRLSDKWQDKSNGKYSYTLLNTLYSRSSHQINNNKSLSDIHLLCESNDLPNHLNTDNYHTASINNVYGHPHSHFVLAVTNVNQLQTLRANIKVNFKKVCGYKPIHLNIQPLLINGIKPAVINGKDDTASITALIKTIKYLLTDYHLQTKDCNLSILQALPPYLAHKIVACQLNSTDNQQCQHYITDNTVNKIIKQINKVKILKRYKSVNIGQSVPLLNNRDVPEIKTANGRTLTHHHTSNIEAIRRFYGGGYYSIATDRNDIHIESIALSRIRRPRVKARRGTTLQNLKQPHVAFNNSFKNNKNKKYLSYYLDTS